MGVLLSQRGVTAVLVGLADAAGESPRLLIFAGPAPALADAAPPADALLLLDAPLAVQAISDVLALGSLDGAPVPTLADGRPAWWRIVATSGAALAQGPAAQLTLSRPVLARGQPVQLGQLRLAYGGRIEAPWLLAGGGP